MKPKKYKLLLIFFFAFSFLHSVEAQNQPEVVNIFPTSDTLPVNIIRFYVEFSKPMQEMGIYNHIHITNEKGNKLDKVFYEHGVEFWNADRTKVTLIIDPARVKQGLIAFNQLGRHFEENQTYHLVVDSLLLDFNNQSLKSSKKKTFVTSKEDFKTPDPKNWKIGNVKPSTSEPLIIIFDDKTDHISALESMIIIQNQEKINGRWKMINDTTVQFTPDKKWNSGVYTIKVHSSFEDLVANSIYEIFDHKVGLSKEEVPTFYNITFIVDKLQNER